MVKSRWSCGGPGLFAVLLLAGNHSDISAPFLQLESIVTVSIFPNSTERLFLKKNYSNKINCIWLRCSCQAPKPSSNGSQT